jgi:hypothetical protein
VAPLTFGVEVERRSFSGFDSREVIDAFAKVVPAPHKVNLSRPDASIVVQLIRNVCAVAVAPRFKELCKYNVRVAADAEDDAAAAAAAGGGGGGGAQKAAAAAAPAAAADGGATKDQRPAEGADKGQQQVVEPEGAGKEAAAAVAAT